MCYSFFPKLYSLILMYIKYSRPHVRIIEVF